MELISGLQELRNLDDIVGDMAVSGDYEADFTDSGDSSNEDKVADECQTVLGDFMESEDEY